MTRIPCPSDYQRGDEFNPGSPDYIEPDVVSGSERVDFDWFFYFDPPHPTLGEELPVIVRGVLEYEDTLQPLSAADKRALRRGMDMDDVDQQSSRSHELFRFERAELPDGRKLDLAQLLTLEGFGDEKTQFTNLKQELVEAAQEALDSPVKTKLTLSRIRQEWIEARTAPSAPEASSPNL